MATSALLVLLMACGAVWCAPHAWAAGKTARKTKKPVAPAQRIAVGTVQGPNGAVAGKAVVYLKDTKSEVIRSYVTDASGNFHFNQLSPDDDYQVWAEVNGHKSKVNTISMFSSHNTFRYKLKVKS